MGRASAAKRQEPATRSEVSRVNCACGHWSGQHLASFTVNISPCSACECEGLTCGECGEQHVPNVVAHERQCAKSKRVVQVPESAQRQAMTSGDRGTLSERRTEDE